MEDPRECFLRKLQTHRGFRISGDYTEHTRDCLLETMFYTIADYVCHERANETGIGNLEKQHSFPREFFDSEDPHEWLESNRSKDDISLIMFVHDHLDYMQRGKHKRILTFIVNTLRYDL